DLAARGHHVLDDEHPFARSDGKTSPKGHSPSLALGKDRPGIKVLADLVGEEDAPHRGAHHHLHTLALKASSQRSAKLFGLLRILQEGELLEVTAAVKSRC